MEIGPARRVTPTVVLVGVRHPEISHRMSAQLSGTRRVGDKGVVLNDVGQRAPAA